jgi:hypothetical protein
MPSSFRRTHPIMGGTVPVSVSRLPRFIVLAGLTLAAACGDSFSPTMQNVAGIYTVTSLKMTTSGATTDELAIGATLKLELRDYGSVFGTLFVPGGGDGGGDLWASMAGTWNLGGDQVVFTQSADTFVGDMLFRATEDQLRGDGVFRGTRVQVTLQRIRS